MRTIVLTQPREQNVCRNNINNRNSRNTVKFTNEKNTLRANHPLQLELDTEVEPDLRFAQCMVDDQVYEECEEFITRDEKWSAILQRLISVHTITGAKVVDGFLYLLHKSRCQLGISDYLNITSKPAKEFLINQAHVNTEHARLDKTYLALSNKYHC